MNMHNTRSLIHTSQACLWHLAVGRSLPGGRIYTQTHKSSKTSDFHRLLLNLTDKINLKHKIHYQFKWIQLNGNVKKNVDNFHFIHLILGSWTCSTFIQFFSIVITNFSISHLCATFEHILKNIHQKCKYYREERQKLENNVR